MPEKPIIVWMRNDLRLSDHPALYAATQKQQPVIPLYIHDLEAEGDWPPGQANRAWTARSLQSLAADLKAHHSRLILKKGNALQILRQIATETGATAIYYNRRCEPRARQQEQALQASGLPARDFDENALLQGGEIRNQQGKPYQVYTAFQKAALPRLLHAACTPEPTTIPPPAKWPASERVTPAFLDESDNQFRQLQRDWPPGEKGALKTLKLFIEAHLDDYPVQRDFMAREATSRLSPHLSHGEITPRTIWQALQAAETKVHAESLHVFQAQILWREFARQLLHHFPHTTHKPLREKFNRFPWSRNAQYLQAWQEAQTGYPIIDAAMLQLKRTGWMHNRARMIVASFLTKHLLLPWQQGAQWFWENLIDADLANNTLGWQWTAGCGADAAPYFRIFNPIRQAERFDPQNAYTLQYLPQLAELPKKLQQTPWKTQTDYPAPLIDHREGRQRALDLYHQYLQ